METADLLSFASVLAQELLLFAACGMILFGIDDVIVDALWIIGKVKSFPSTPPLPALRSNKQIAIFVPAWKEAEVIGHMLKRCLSQWQGDSYQIFVGTYPNDPATTAVAANLENRKIECVVLDRHGPTTKADCLNGLWIGLQSFEAREGVVFDVVLLHDAEDQVHPAELNLFGAFCEYYDLVQIPVVPATDPRSRWISGHYLDEFAEAHRKELVVRQALGASVPSAGTGCAISRRALDHIAAQRSGLPFDETSLTEDYELGLRLWQEGFSSRFVRAVDPQTRTDIVVSSCFPASINTSVRQKTRWIIGIALAGWDRTGWHGNLIEHWMRWRDRRVILAATLILAGYCGMILWLICRALGQATQTSQLLATLLEYTLIFVFWRLGVRASFTAIQYGWREGLRSIPRLIPANIISVMAASRAVSGYMRLLVTGTIKWDKTAHIFPSDVNADRP